MVWAQSLRQDTGSPTLLLAAKVSTRLYVSLRQYFSVSPQRLIRAKDEQDRLCKYTRNIEACSRNHCCCGKAVSISYSECVFVDLGFRHSMRIRHIVICDLP